MRGSTKAYALGIVALGVAVLVRWLLDPLLGDALPVVTIFGAVAAAVWLGGYRPALVIAILGYFVCHYLFIPPRGQLDLTQLGNVIGLVAYLFTCALIIAFGEKMRTAQVRDSERREVLRVTLSSIGDAVITTDTTGRITYLNKVAENITGWTHGDALGQPLDNVCKLVNEVTRQPVENPATRALREGVAVGLANHTVLIQKNGKECPIDDSAAPIRDDHGNVLGGVLIFRDVTAQRLVERGKANQLLTARLLASIVESSNDAIIGKSLDGMIQTWNAGAERVFGFTADQAVGQHISLVIPPDRLAEEDEILTKLRAGQRIEHFETERRRGDGKRILVSLTISPIRDEAGNVVGASKIVRDVTRQRQVDERERELLAQAAAANAKFHAFFDQGPLFAGIMDLDGTILEPNRLSWEGCGFTREQIVGKPFWEGPWWTPSPTLVEQIKKASAEAAAGKTFRAELPYFVGDGSERMADVTIQPIRDETGRVLFLAPTGTDITDRKRAEADRKRLADDLKKLAADLSAADQRKNEFLATLAHELRNPLAPLCNMLEVLKRADGDLEMQQRARDTIERQLGQMVRLVDDLLDLNRITHDRLELRQSEVELASVMQQAVEVARPLVDSANHDLRVTLPAEPIYLHADPARLAQVFGNLLSNSCRYTKPGGTIWVRAQREDGDVVVTVKDTGAGIPPDKLASVFDMFTQVDRSPERSQGGLGIGLTLVKRLVEMHGGEVEARSAGEGQGSEFVVRLPVLRKAVEPVTAGPIAAPAPPPARRILIVDDNIDSADSLAMLLQITGNQTFLAHDGQEAIAAVEKHRPDVVLLDIGLPKLSGHDVCRRVRELSWGKDIVVVALTGWGQEEDRRKSQEAGFDGHLVKPVNYDELVELLNSLSNGR